jgi:hypothetical protein
MTDCRHHWILSQPQADIVLGRCKKCDGERVFPSRLDGTDRGHDYLEATTGAGMTSGWGRPPGGGMRAA